MGTALVVSDNRLLCLSESIGNLTRLARLSAIDNRLTQLEPEFGNLRCLTQLDTDNNPLQCPPPEIIGRGAAATVSFMHSILVGRGTGSLNFKDLSMSCLLLPWCDLSTQLTVLDASRNK